MNQNGNKFDRWIEMSAVLHGLVFTLVVFSPTLFPMQGDASWGSNTSGDGVINVRISTSMTGVSLPSPEVVTEGAAAFATTALHKSEESSPPPHAPEPDATSVP